MSRSLLISERCPIAEKRKKRGFRNTDFGILVKASGRGWYVAAGRRSASGAPEDFSLLSADRAKDSSVLVDQTYRFKLILAQPFFRQLQQGIKK
jgi:hypothetical protein